MSLYSLPCLQEVAHITVLWSVRGAAGLFLCEGMTVVTLFNLWLNLSLMGHVIYKKL